MRRWIPACLGAMLMTVTTGSFSVVAAQQYHLKTEIKVGGDPQWDFIDIDPAARRAYFPHGNTVTIINLDTNTVAGEIHDTAGLGGVVAVNPLSRVFIKRGGQESGVAIVDAKTNQILSKVKTPAPDYSMYDPAQKEVWVFNVRNAQSATVIDAASGNIVTTVPLGGTPELAASDPGSHRLFVNLIDKNSVVAMDTRSHQVLSSWPLAPCQTPTGLVMDIERHRIFSSCRGENPVMVMLDNRNGKVLASVSLDPGVDQTAYDPGTRLIFNASGGSFTKPVAPATLKIVKLDKGDKLTVVQTLKMPDGAKAVAVDTKTHDIYLPVSRYEPIQPGEARPKRIPDSFTVQVYSMK